ncbi:MAG: hypothetical protein J0H26_00370, partial [Alphaproteobacteria bacterium]|nr:hypothetical protein [Alphaproteobacteria bacterium]
SILADRLPASQRDKARLLGLSLAMFIRILLLLSINWIANLTNPLFHILGHGFSGRDLILLGGGIFLINLIAAGDDDPLPGRILRNLGRVWRNTRLLDRMGWDSRNAIALAGSVRGLKRPRLLMMPARRARAIAAILKSMAFRAIAAADPARRSG